MAAIPPAAKRQQGREELHRTIMSLSLDFQLHLQVPDPTISPSKRRQQRRTSEQERVDAIYSRAQYLQYKDPRHLSTSIGRFRQQADQLMRDWTTGKRYANPDAAPTSSSFDPLRARPSLEERAALQTLLLDLLKNVNSLPPTRAKRQSPELTGRDPGPKRPKAHSFQDVDSLDDIPVRSRTSTGTSATTPSQSRSSSFLSRSTGSSSRLSFASSVFSTTAGGISSSQTTIESVRPPKVALVSPPTSEHQHERLDDPLRHYDTQPPTPKTPSPIRPQHHDAHCNRSSPPGSAISTYSSVPDIVEMRTPIVDSRLAKTSLPTLADRLSHIWPRFPVPGLTEAPFIILWELTRAAIHCSVDLTEWNLEYKPGDDWHDQAKFRGKLALHRLFVGKGLPPPCDANSWTAGLATFSSADKIVTLSVELMCNTDASLPLFQLKLQPPRLELGHRLGRRFGGDRFLEVTLPSPNGKDVPSFVKQSADGPEQIIKWLTDKPHYFVGRSWAPFYTVDVKKKIKDTQDPQDAKKTRNIFQQRVHFFAVDGISFQLPRSQFPPLHEASNLSTRTKMRRYDLLSWALNIKNNADQPVTKLFSRLALSLSRTCPTITLEQHQIRNQEADLGTKKVMNDGIGRMSRSVARKVAAKLGLSETPCCYQARFGSAKGIWLVDVEDDGLENNDWIETYPSQRKWKCDFKDLHHRTFEVRNWPRELRSASLNQQFIPVLEAQSRRPGDMRRAIENHLVNGLQTELDEQIAAMNHPTLLRAWIKRTGFSSVGGLSQVHTPFLAGLPERDEDIIAFLLDSGFDTSKNEYLKEMVWKMRKRQTELLKVKMNITIPRSTYAYMVVDFTGTLEEGEVHLAFSSKFQVNEESDTLLDGIDVLVARSPAHFVSDIQKVKAVFKPGLKRLKDVIVFPSKGDSPLADMLSGGDYDGDQAWVCWDPEIVQNFTNSPEPPKPNLIKQGYLRKSNSTFQSIVDKPMDMESACATFLNSAISFSMQSSLLGICTSFKERLCYYENSVSSERAVALSTLVGLLVDQSKQGLLFSDDDYSRLKRDMKMRGKDPQYLNERGSHYFNRDGSIHILDYLRFEVADVIVNKALASFSKVVEAKDVQKFDEDLTWLFKEYEEYGKGSRTYEKLLTHLRTETQAVEAKWKNTMNPTNTDTDFNTKLKAVFEEWISIQPPPDLMQSRTVLGLLNLWNGDSTMNTWTLLKASALFKWYYKFGYSMVWRLAGQQLARIKATASRGRGDVSSVVVTAQMWNVLRPDSKRITALAARRDGVEDNESLAAIEDISEFDEYGTQLDDT
ncbi:RNA dependent RNA polymerase-domain-containing protein [Dactylonectria estremocensis]|uniref:RNA-dependent RNA polymerase n=1 Tax=Dactylonectria estremocensis TaxID=1079267 RepID=A0A9P9FJK3_9HYPO|nr:RNA dependent RNA polymerase-domain-containing protein [Dactylonectria estremocensis]